MTAMHASRRTVLLGAGLSLFATRAAMAAAMAAGGDGAPYGVIEVGSSGVKPSIVRILNGVQPDLKVVKILDATEANAIDAQNAPIVAAAVKKAIDDMIAAGISPNLITIVGSSGVAEDAGTKAAVAAAVAKQTTIKMDFVGVDKEVEYTFDGVVNKVKLAHRRPQVALVDIGSGNTKGGYVMSAPGSGERFQIFSMKFGTKSFARKVQAAAAGGPEEGGKSFAQMARQVAESDLRPAIQKMLIDAGPVLAQRSRIYLNGGLPWAVATTQNPTNTDRYVPLTQAAIDRFCTLAATDQKTLFTVDTRGIANPDHKKLIEGDLAKLSDTSVKPIFTAEEYMAGAELLRILSQEMRMAEKTLFFTRPGRVAWILGLTYDKAADGQISNVVLPTT